MRNDPSQFVWLPGPCVHYEATSDPTFLYLLGALAIAAGVIIWVRGLRRLRAPT